MLNSKYSQSIESMWIEPRTNRVVVTFYIDMYLLLLRITVVSAFLDLFAGRSCSVTTAFVTTIAG